MSAVPPLTLSFDPRTIEHLGIRMYSHVPNAVAELVANAYDADATQVEVIIGSDHSITVTDDGHGMSRQDVADKYLRIGRNRRQTQESAKTESGRRWVSGKKGLGKLALFGIGRVVEVTTARTGESTATRITEPFSPGLREEG
ncbi:ATP-binding protein [Actinomyces qiguomingii]|uniref:ATP-binding protein n=1 Tax=Actinomyces qiguomingii TaxID=2057800 RepID=UPI000CA03E86|nr:ATP-binding protein [Actinomyces qiguomingii]